MLEPVWYDSTIIINFLSHTCFVRWWKLLWGYQGIYFVLILLSSLSLFKLYDLTTNSFKVKYYFSLLNFLRKMVFSGWVFFLLFFLRFCGQVFLYMFVAVSLQTMLLQKQPLIFYMQIRKNYSLLFPLYSLRYSPCSLPCTFLISCLKI